MRQSQGVITENFNVLFNNTVNKVMNDLRVGTLCRVISVNNDRTINVKPIITEEINTITGSKFIQLPELHNINYILGQYPKINDYVICVHLDRSNDSINLNTISNNEFLESNAGKHSISNCVAILINNKEEWDLIGTYSATSTLTETFEGYSQIKMVLIYAGIQMDSVVYDIQTTTQYRIIVNDGTVRHADLVNSDGVYTITPNNCSVLVYAR
ncbi:MAG: hypothetical protein RR342_01070 [Bacilli bacterium]|jgi:hypothetical protein